MASDPDTEIVDADVVTTMAGRNFTLVRVETADGLAGYGDATLNGREKAVEAALEHHVVPDLLGMDARRVEHVWQYLFRNTYWRGGPVLNTALSGVDQALWDLKGKLAGVPVYDLLGGRTRDYAPVYQHCGAGTPADIAANVDRARDRGIRHFRVNVHGDPDEYLDLDAVAEGVLEVRDRVGPGPELLVDVHGRATPIEAARLCTRLEPAELFFVEDPIRPEYPDAFEVVRRASTAPLAMGELFTNPWEMLPLVEGDLVDFVRTDLAHVGGVTAARKLATLAEHHYVRTAFHGPGDLGPVGYAATVHVDLSVPNFGVQEFTDHEAQYGERVAEVFDGGAVFREGDGGVDVPDQPGLGIDVDWEAARAYADDFEHRPLPAPRAPDGSVRDW